jgi:hypothetical protein
VIFDLNHLVACEIAPQILALYKVLFKNVISVKVLTFFLRMEIVSECNFGHLSKNEMEKIHITVYQL